MERIENKIEKRNNKKNVQKKVLMVAGLALLLGFVGYTGGTTYAKYVTSQNTGSLVATVAKWGYTISANAQDLFNDKYAVNTGVVDEAGTAVVSADSTGATEIVAPGTTGSFQLTVKGTAEVMSSLTFASVGEISDISVADATNYYYPIKWTVTITKGDNGVGTITAPANNGSLTTASLVSWIDGLDVASIPANENVDIDLTFSWKWAFTGQTSVLIKTPAVDPNPVVYYTGDELDTFLANKKAGTGIVDEDFTYSLDMKFGVSITAEQIQPNS